MADPVRHRVLVVELSDAVGPRRRPDRPNVWVGTTTVEPKERLEQIRRSTRQRSALVRDHGVRLRPDLYRSYPPTDANDVRRQKRRLMEKLTRKGFAVNGDATVWRLYVIRLDDAVGERTDPSKPWVYVGQTSKAPEERLREHLSGARNAKGPLFSRVVHRHGIELVPELYEHLEPLYTKADAERAEAALAESLADEGYSVRGGH